MSTLSFLTSSKAVELIDQVGAPFAKAPHLPENVRAVLAKISPWLALLGGVLGIFGGLSTFGAQNTYNSFMAYAPQLAKINPSYFLISGVLSLVSGAIMLMAFKPLQARKKEGWIYIFWSDVVGVVQSVVSLLLAAANPAGVVVGILVSFYLLFEMRSEFKN